MQQKKTSESTNLSHRWQAIIGQARREYAELGVTDIRWIETRLAQVAELQGELQALVDSVDIESLCRDCGGSCCDCGKNHFGLPNLLFFLMEGDVPPSVDFGCGCPFLTDGGCRLPATRRPFNCVTFICPAVEERLAASERTRFYAIERQLREVYQEFARRYAGAGAHGLLLRSERLGGRRLFSPGLNDRIDGSAVRHPVASQK